MNITRRMFACCLPLILHGTILLASPPPPTVRPNPPAVNPLQTYRLQPASSLRPARPCPPPQYWQQEVRYDIHVTLNDTTHTLTGSETFIYINHSPDTLRFIYIHCWPNAYRDTTTALFRQLTKLEERKSKLDKKKEAGYIDRLAFTVDDIQAATEADSGGNADILKLVLPQPLLPGKMATIATPFLVKIPSYFSRLGHEGRSYMITQWYPKPAVYDSKGWHAMPYLDQGEFYSEFGTFDVHITLPSSYVVAATGVLQNAQELAAYRQAGRANGTNPVAPVHYRPAASAARKTLDYHAENVHDFGWFADKDFFIGYDTMRLASGRTIDVFSWYRPNGDRAWRQSVSYIKDAVRHYSAWIGEYGYPVVNAVEGPGNSSSGGMEYPMITLITSPHAAAEDLDGVITHEVGHNWFYGMLGSNEREHPWMDEGINTFFEFRYEAEKYHGNSMMGSVLPHRMKKLGIDEFLDEIYYVITQLKASNPIETPAAAFPSEFEYGLVAYARTAAWMHILEKGIGKDALDAGIHAYFDKWKFKHPYPEDLQASLETVTHSSLDKFFNLLNSNELL